MKTTINTQIKIVNKVFSSPELISKRKLTYNIEYSEVYSLGLIMLEVSIS